MIATQEGLKMVMTITWRLSIFRKKKDYIYENSIWKVYESSIARHFVVLI